MFKEAIKTLQSLIEKYEGFIIKIEIIDTGKINLVYDWNHHLEKEFDDSVALLLFMEENFLPSYV